MCDKKYMNEYDGLQKIEEFLQEKIAEDEVKMVKDFISTLSYSTVKKVGFPKFNDYQTAYHIVREADLLSAYNFDRGLIYSMNKYGTNADDAFIETVLEC